MVMWFAVEYIMRLWSAGCRFRYQDWVGRLRFARKPLCIVGTLSIVLATLSKKREKKEIGAVGSLRMFPSRVARPSHHQGQRA